MSEREPHEYEIYSNPRLDELLRLKKQTVFEPKELCKLSMGDLRLLESFYHDEAEHCTRGVPLDMGSAEANLVAVRDQIESKIKTAYFTQISFQVKKR